jgi:hypothetical protein
MGDKITVIEDDPKPEPEVIIVAPQSKPKVEKTVTEKTTVVETRDND